MCGRPLKTNGLHVKSGNCFIVDIMLFKTLYHFEVELQKLKHIFTEGLKNLWKGLIKTSCRHFQTTEAALCSLLVNFVSTCIDPSRHKVKTALAFV